ncbi:hypothetical protein LSTR_LSTR004049 [Laodelphax striatellus]|uniref:NADP-dependent oxidoreductase domain-containing protein n=1 Tax=Laodelphax striatellus TaxID=195883 RepID=A0A482WG48_LAOST|nr:hypothetical protein LSTR_LSTR004049 [Laodelphax striatellus]
MALPETFVREFHDEHSVRKMKYIPLGNTGLKLSELSFGCGPLGGKTTYGAYDEEEGKLAVKMAIQKGINYLDTAPAYGQGHSEEVLGQALVGIPRNAYYVSTKVSRYGNDWDDMFDRSASAVNAGFELSLRSLGLNYVDILFVHDVEFGPIDQILTETLPAVKKLQDEGKVKHIGISGYPLDVLKDIKERSTVPIDVVLSYSRELIFDHTLQEFIPFFQQNKMGIVNAALTGMGILTRKGPPSWHPADSKLKELCRQATNYADEKGTDIAKLGIAHSLKQSGCHSNLVGMSSLAELDKNLDVYFNGLNENEERVLNEIKDKFFSEEKNYHWEGKEIESYLSFKKMQRKCTITV